MRRFHFRFSKQLLPGTSLFLLLVLAFAACGGSTSNSNNATPAASHSTATTGTSSTTTSTGTGSGDTTPAQPAGVVLGAQACPDALKDPAHWDAIIPTQSGISKVESVTCGNLRGNATLQALVTVRSAGSGAFLDVYVFDNITSPSPSQLFKLLGLDKGDAKISGYNTVLTAEVDASSSINAGKDNADLVQDLSREFKWSDGAGTFVPVAFPGLFPDLTRFQAEADQANVNAGHQPWKLSATMTAQALAANVNLLKWNPNAPATIVTGGGAHDTKAVVVVKSANPAGSSIKVTLYRLEGNTKNGIWEATAVEVDGMSITSPAQDTSITSPVPVSGSGNAFEGKIGTVTVLDHLYTDIGHTGAVGASGNGNTTFTANVKYNPSFHGGYEEGIIMLTAYSNADGSIASAVMVKELISG